MASTSANNNNEHFCIESALKMGVRNSIENHRQLVVNCWWFSFTAHCSRPPVSSESTLANISELALPPLASGNGPIAFGHSESISNAVIYRSQLSAPWRQSHIRNLEKKKKIHTVIRAGSTQSHSRWLPSYPFVPFYLHFNCHQILNHQANIFVWCDWWMSQCQESWRSNKQKQKIVLKMTSPNWAT